MRILVLASLAIVLAGLAVLNGCSSSEDSKPSFSRIVPLATCGVVPYEVEFLAVVTGGAQGTDPTGANMWYEITWEFGDGDQASGSKVYHTYTASGTYAVRALARDANGAEAEIFGEVRVLPDTLLIAPSANIPSGSTITAARDTLRFDVVAQACGLESADDSQYSRFVFVWTMPDAVYRERRPVHLFDIGLTDTQWVHVSVEYPARSVTRLDSMFYVLETPLKRYVDLSVDLRGEAAIDTTVHLAGSFNGWDPAATPMTDADADSIFTYRLEVDPDTEHLFRFVNGDTTDDEETVPAACGVSDGMGGLARQVVVTDDDVVYTTVFGTCPE